MVNEQRRMPKIAGRSGKPINREERSEVLRNDYYVSYSGRTRDWSEAVKYGFVSAGGAPRYSSPLKKLSRGDRIWVRVPRSGYVGVGIVRDARIPIDQFIVPNNGARVPIISLPLKISRSSSLAEGKEKAEYLVRVKWLKTVNLNEAIDEIGLFANRNTVAKPKVKSWNRTIERLAEVFGVMRESNGMQKRRANLPRRVDDIAVACVYDIVHSRHLREAAEKGGFGTIVRKRRRWVTAKALFRDALHANKNFLVVFAHAEDTRRIVAYASLTKITVRRLETSYQFHNLRFFDQPFPKTSLRTLKAGTRIPAGYIRPYVICRTPEDILSRMAAVVPPFYGLNGEEIFDRYPEGSVRSVRVNAYERNAKARFACISVHGSSCAICNFNFGRMYGARAEGFIQVHHLVPMSKLKKQYEIDPVHELVPVCPNCHAVIHFSRDPYTVKDVKAMLTATKRLRNR